jgi:DNA-binding CsgD family transcriptional regulator
VTLGAEVSKKSIVDHQKPVVESCIKLLAFLSSCSSLEEVCRRLVHDKRFKGEVAGAYSFRLESDNRYALETYCGQILNLVGSQLFNEDGGSLEVMPIRGDSQFLENGSFRALIIPLMRKGVPERIFVLQLSESAKTPIVHIDTLRIIQATGQMIIESLPLLSPNGIHAKALPPGFELNERHRAILAFIGLGLTNRQIASRLLVSESIVRQENIKIFRYLKASNRKQAFELGQDHPPPNPEG